jgi:hypothetical protein
MNMKIKRYHPLVIGSLAFVIFLVLTLGSIPICAYMFK